MRVSSLSDARIIELISRHFVPVWLSRDRYQQEKIDREEQLLLGRIDLSRRTKKLEGGAVCVYVVAHTGDVLATLTVHKAWKPDLLIAFLKKIIADEKVKPKKAEKVEKKVEAPKAKGKDARLLAVRTRLDGGDNRGTSRDLVELTKEEWSAFLPPQGAKAGKSWKVKPAVAEKVLKHAYPPLPNWDAKLAKMSSCELKATVKSLDDGEAVIRLEGKLDLIYPHKGEPTDGRVTARLVGVVRCDVNDGKLTTLELTSDGATYAWRWQDKPLTKATSIAVELLE
jgi:hypothetical protein